MMLSEISKIVFPGINQNTIVNLMADYLCSVLLRGSETLSLDTNKKYSAMWSNSLMNPGVSITTMIPMHITGT